MKRASFIYLFAALVFLAAVGTGWGQTVTLISPNTTGLTWSGVEFVEWTTTGFGAGDTLVLQISSDGGIGYDTVARNLSPDLEIFRFHTTTLINGPSYRVKIFKSDDPGVFDASGHNFTVSNPITGQAYYVNDTDTSDDVYCSATGSDANDGLSPATPRLTVQRLIDDYILGPGDVVFIDTGEWIRAERELTVTSADQGTEISPLYFAGSPNGTVFSGNFIPDSSTRIYIDRSAHLSLSTLTLENCLASSCYLLGCNNIYIESSKFWGNSQGLYSNSSNISSLIGNVFEGNNTEGFVIYRGSNFVLADNEIINNGGIGADLYGVSKAFLENNIVSNNSSHGISISSSSFISISENTCDNNSGTNINLGYTNNCQVVRNFVSTPGSYNIYSQKNSRIAILNNLIYGNGIYVGRYNNYLWNLNNIIWSYQPNSYCVYRGSAYGGEQILISDFNILFPTGGARAGYWNGAQADLRNWILASGQDGRSLSQIPLFVDFDGGDYHPQSTEGSYHQGSWTNDSSDSPALNAGRPADAVTSLAAPLAAGATSVQLVSAAGFLSGPEWVQIDDDIVGYSGISGNNLTGCSGVLADHAAGTGVFQPIGSSYDREPGPNGQRVNIGPYGNNEQASKSSRKTLLVTFPAGGPEGEEKLSGQQEIDWRTIGTGWIPGDTLLIAYSSDSANWNLLTEEIAYDSGPFPDWNTQSFDNSATGRIRISHTSGEPIAASGIFISDNTPPVIGLLAPENGTLSQSINTALISQFAADTPAGLNPSPYYFRLDTRATFDSPDLRTSGWIAGRIWYNNLQGDTDYYWQVRARDDAEPSNAGEFRAETDVPGSYWKFRTARVLHADDIESATTGLRWILANYDLGPGDTVYVNPGSYSLQSEPLVLPAGDGGDENSAVRIEGLNGEVLLDGGSLLANCLRVTGDYFEIENISCTNAVGSGIVISGNHNTLQGGRSYLNGGDGVEIRGDYNTVRNYLVYDNLKAGFHLSAAYRNQLENNTSAGNGTREIFLEDAPPNGSIETSLLNNILSTSGVGRTALYVESESRIGLESDYNLLYAASGADIGHWGGIDLATFSQWTETSFQDQSSLSANPLFAGGGNYRLRSTRGSYKPGIGWTADGSDSPGLDRGRPYSACYLEPAPNGGVINLGAYGNTLEASLSPAAAGSNFYANDGETAYDYFCSTGGAPWPLHDGLSAASPLDSIDAVFTHHTVEAGDTIYIDTGIYPLSNPVVPPVPGSDDRPLSFAGSPRGSVLDGQGISPYCFELDYQPHITIGGLTLVNPTENSLYARQSPYLNFSGNRVVGSGADGVYLYQTYQATLDENLISNNVGSGFWAYQAYQGLRIRDNRFSDNADHGVYVSRGSEAEITGNTFRDNGKTGVYLASVSGLRVDFNNLSGNGTIASGNEAGIYLAGGSGAVVANNTITGSRSGIENRTAGSLITGNRLSGNYRGLYLYSGSDTRTENNLVYANQIRGAELYAGANATLKNNVFYQNGGNEISLTYLCSGTRIRNNIICPDGIDNCAINVSFGSVTPASRNHQFDYNIFRLTGGAYIGNWQVRCDALWSWQTQSRQDGHSFEGDPRFSNPAAGDFHLRSTKGRFSEGEWFYDGSDSPGLNRGDPGNDYSNEPSPDGERINIGAYGNTHQASRSSIKTLAVVSPLGTADGEEKWSLAHDISWQAIGTGWGGSELVTVEYTTDGSSFTAITENISWQELTYRGWPTTVIADTTTARVRVRQTAGGTAEASSGLFIADNTPPIGVGSHLPPDGAEREPLSATLVALPASDSPAGLNDAPYSFQIDTSPLFDTAGLQNSGWLETLSWNPELSPNTWYYWQVKVRDAADPPNESAFCAATDLPGSFRSFKTAGVYHALDVESPTDGLRWILENVDLQPGDTVYVNPGNYALSAPLEFSGSDAGDEDDPVRIIGTGGEVLLDGTGLENCLVISGDYIEVENFSCTNADASGVLVTGNHDTVRNGRSFDNGGDGIEVTGDWTIIRNMLVYGNGEAGIHLFTSHHSTLENNTCSGNGTREIFLEDEPANVLHPARPVGSTYATLSNNILDAAGPGRFAVFLEEISQTEFASDYNLFHASGGAAVGYWNSATQGLFSAWTGASGRDFNSLYGDPFFIGGNDYHLQSTRGSYHGGAWSADTADSPGLDAGNPDSLSFYEPAPHAGRANLGAYGNTTEASWSALSTITGKNYYVNDSSAEWDYYCATGGLPWPEHDGLSPDRPLDSLADIINRYSLYPGDTVYVDTGFYPLDAPISFPGHGNANNPITIAGSPRGTVFDGGGTVDYCFNLLYSYISLANLTILNTSDYGIYAGGAHHLVLAGIRTQGAGSHGVYTNRSANVSLINCVSSFNEGHGFYLYYYPGEGGATCRGCSAENNSGNGLYTYGGVSHKIYSCILKNNDGDGLKIANAYGTPTVSGNLLDGNLGIGLSLAGNSSAGGAVITGNHSRANTIGFEISFPATSTVSGNRSEANAREGFSFQGARNPIITNNLSIRNGGYGYLIEKSPETFLLNNASYRNEGEVNLVAHITNKDITIRNNVLWASGGTQNSALEFGAAPASMQWRSDYNCLMATGGSFIGHIPPDHMSTLFEWQVASGLDGGSIDYNPLFVDPDGGDFHLESPLGSYHDGYWTADLNTSPALNQGQPYTGFSQLATDLFPAAPYIDLDDAAGFTASTNLVEINRDIIQYTGKSGNRLTGVTGIATTHPVGSWVFQPVGSDYTREPEPHGERIDIGAYGNTGEAGLAKTLTLPILRPLARELWSGEHNITWLAIPVDEWTEGEPIRIEHSTDGFNTSHLVADWHFETSQPQNYAWNTLSAGGDSSTCQVRLISTFNELTTTSAVFTIDNTSPVNAGCLLPEDGDRGLPTYVPLRGMNPVDVLAGLHAQPYYFQLDTSSAFAGAGLQSSGWLARNAWRPVLEPGITYYWRTKVRDAADPPNETVFCGFTADTDGYGTFSTAHIFRAEDIESETTGLRWILDNYEISPADTIIIAAGFHAMSEPVTISVGGSRYFPLRIAGSGAGTVLDGGGAMWNCLSLEADYVILENISFTSATGPGLVVAGANNVVREGASYLHGGTGVEISGPANELVNFLAYGNGGNGVLLSGAEGNRVVNVTSHGNGLGEITCANAPYSFLHNNILWATATGTHSIYVDAVSETGFASDYNNLIAAGPAYIGHWGGDQADLAAWRGASFQDQSSISLDPLFADPAGGDYHLKSQGGRWAGWIAWTTVDTETSPSIDAGDPADSGFRESSPKGGRINQGAFGNSFQASRSYRSGEILPGTNYYLNDDSTEDGVYTTAVGSDGNTGRTPAAPKRTLDKGILAFDLEPGDTVYIDTGEYPLSGQALIYALHSGAPGNPVSLVGSHHISLIDGNFLPAAQILFQGAEYISLGQIHSAGCLGNNEISGSGYGIRMINSKAIDIRDSVISWHGQADGEGGGGVILSQSDDISLEGNQIGFNTNVGVNISNGSDISLTGNLIRSNRSSGISAGTTSELLLTDNIVYNNYAAGIRLTDASLGEVLRNAIYSNRNNGIYANGSELELGHNLVYDNNYGGPVISRMGIRVGGTDLAVFNNTLYRNRGTELRTDSSGVAFSNNIVWTNGIGSHAFWFENATDQFSDFNILTATNGGAIGHWTSGTSYTIEEWQLSSRLDPHSLGGDPVFVDPAGPDMILGGNFGEDDDFHIRSTDGSFHFERWLADGSDSPGLNAGKPADPYDYETDPNGARINIGAYGNTREASRSSLDSLFLSSPYGGSIGDEKWSGEHDLIWAAYGPGWGVGDTVDLEYTTNGTDFLPIDTAAWDLQTYSTWDTAALPDGRFYQVRVSDSANPSLLSISGRFIVDNTPPANVGLVSPTYDFRYVDPENADLQARAATDSLAGLNLLPYYFRVDTTPDFNSAELITSGWMESRNWNTQSLIPDTWYYWQVKARDDADLPNESAFCGFTVNTEGYGTFKTVRVYHVSEVEGAGELRDVLLNAPISEGDIIRLRAEGDFEVTGSGVVVPDFLTGMDGLPIRIEGYNGRPLVYGDGLVDFLLDVRSDYTLVEGIDFTGSADAGVLVSGDHNTVNRCQSFEQGGAGIEVTGISNLIKNNFCYLNGDEGIFLNGATDSRAYNNSLYGNRAAGLGLTSAIQSNLRNNISWSLDTGSVAISVDSGSQTGLVSDYNDLYRTESGLIGLWGAQTQDTFNNWRGASGQDANSISADPGFYQIALRVNKEYIYDLHLHSPGVTSPCFNRGVSLAGVVNDDYDGETRPFGAGVDIGADEWVNTNPLNSLPDYWELYYFGNLDPNRRDDHDPDADFLENIREYNNYTDPTNPDTDADGLADGDEVDVYLTNPLDSDSDWDGLNDGDEIAQFTDPADPDTDGDGLLDGEDVSAVGMEPERSAYFASHNIVQVGDWFKGEITAGTDPLDPDTDDDWCPDGWEVFYGLNPLDDGATNINDGGIGDPDGDRLNNYEEYLFGTSPIDSDDPITRYVDRNASGANNGTSWANAWNAIQASLDWKAQTGVPVIVLVSGGIYYESGFELDENHEKLALMGAHPYQRPLIYGDGSARIFTSFNLQTAKIDSLEIRNGYSSLQGGAFYLFSSSPILSNLLINNNVATYGGAVFIIADSHPMLFGNTIVKNTGTSGGYGGVYVASGTPRIFSNIIWHNGVDLRAVLTTDQIRYNNLGSQEGGFNIIGYAGNRSEEPRLRHLGANRLHLATFFGQTNPNINTGTSRGTMLADYEGEERYYYLLQPAAGGGITGLNYWDIGADEYLDTDYNTLPDWWEMNYWGAIGQDPDLDEDLDYDGSSWVERTDGLTNYFDYYYLTNPRKYDTAVSGMSDGEEVEYWNSTHGIDWPDSPPGPQRWDSDADFDGIINILDADSDDDKLIDGFSLDRSVLTSEDEAMLESVYFIVDANGWFMGERTVGTDPANPDTDDDWLDDGDEVYYWVYTHNERHPDSAQTGWDTDWDGDGTANIVDWDADGDLTPDGWEALYDLDPNDDGYYYLEHGAGGDPDDDRLNNYIEYLFETHPRDGDDPDYVIVDINGTVGVDCDYNYIKDAIADNEGPIRIIVRPGVYPESNIAPKEKMALLGEYAHNTIIDAGGQRGVSFSGIEAALLDGFTITNGYNNGPGAGIFCYAASPFISNSIISFNTSSGVSGRGAAIFAMGESAPIVVNCTIASNRGTDGVGGVALYTPDDTIFLINNILWDNQTDLLNVQTDMVHYSNLGSGIYEGVNFNLSTDPIFHNPLLGDFHIFWQSPMVCTGGYPLAGGYDMDGASRPQLSCPPWMVDCTEQNSFNIGAHEQRYEPSPTPSVTPSTTPTITPTPSVTPSITPTPVPPSPPPPPPTPPIPPPTRTPTPEPTLSPTPPMTPYLPTRTPTPIPTATPEQTPSPTPYGCKTPTPSPSPIDFYYRDPVQNSWLDLYINGTYDTYYSIGWAGDDWLPIYGLPPYTWYAPVWSYGTGSGETQWGEWTYHGTETQYLEPDWPTPTPTPVPDFRYMDPFHVSYLRLYIDFTDTYYSIGWAGDGWQYTSSDLPDFSYYCPQWTREDNVTLVGEWFYHSDQTQDLVADWPSPTPTPPTTATPTPWIATPTPSVTPTVTPTPTPSYAYWYSAAGATEINGLPFDTYFAVNNPTADDAYVEFVAVDKNGLIRRVNDVVSPESRYTLYLNDMLAGYDYDHSSVSMMIYDLTDKIILVDRAMYWDTGGNKWEGGHNSVVSNTRANAWYLPEGATHYFDLYIHVLNPDPYYYANAQVTFMDRLSRTWTVQTVLMPESNWTIYANDIVGEHPYGAATKVISLPTEDPAARAEYPPDGRVPLAVDRTMYWDTLWGQTPVIRWIDGHASRGTTENSTRWYLGEGTSALFDTFILISNPSETESAEVKVTFMDRSSQVIEHFHTLPPHSRYTIWTNHLIGEIAGFSTTVESLNDIPIYCERAQYWKPNTQSWDMGHASLASPYLSPVWYLPEGATEIFQEYILVGNPDPVRDANIRATFYFETGPPEHHMVTVPPHTRKNIRVNDYFITNAVSTRLEETTEPFSEKLPFMAERAMYWNVPPTGLDGRYWGGGHGTIGIDVRNEQDLD